MAASMEAAASRSVSVVREVVGVFDDQERLQIAVDRLQECGINRHDVSTIGRVEQVDAALRHAYVDVREIEDDGEVPRRIVVSKTSLGDAEGALIGGPAYLLAMAVGYAATVKGAGWPVILLAAALAGMLGAIIGWMLARALDRKYRRSFQDHLRRGGIVLWVAVRDAEHERRALEVLGGAGARDVHVHELDTAAKPIPGWRGVSYELSFMKRLRL